MERQQHCMPHDLYICFGRTLLIRKCQVFKWANGATHMSASDTGKGATERSGIKLLEFGNETVQ